MVCIAAGCCHRCCRSARPYKKVIYPALAGQTTVFASSYEHRLPLRCADTTCLVCQTVNIEIEGMTAQRQHNAAAVASPPPNLLNPMCAHWLSCFGACRQQTAEQQLQLALESGEAVDVVSMSFSTQLTGPVTLSHATCMQCCLKEGLASVSFARIMACRILLQWGFRRSSGILWAAVECWPVLVAV
jgi:hypothetical protein